MIVMRVRVNVRRDHLLVHIAGTGTTACDHARVPAGVIVIVLIVTIAGTTQILHAAGGVITSTQIHAGAIGGVLAGVETFAGLLERRKVSGIFFANGIHQSRDQIHTQAHTFVKGR
jgi:hypothetical protein